MEYTVRAPRLAGCRVWCAMLVWLLSFTPASAVQVDEPAPEIALSRVINAPSSGTISLEQLRGQAVVLEFWATWCGPCVAAIPHMNSLAGQFAGRNVTFLAITDEEESTVSTFLEKRPISFPVGLDRERKTFAAYGIQSLPSTVLIAPDGTLEAVSSPKSVTPEVLEDLVAGRKLSLGDAREVLDGSGLEERASETSATFRMIIRPSRFDRTIGGSGTPDLMIFRGYNLRQLLASAYYLQRENIEFRDGISTEELYDVLVQGRPRRGFHITEEGLWYSPILRPVLLDTFAIRVKIEEIPEADQKPTTATAGERRRNPRTDRKLIVTREEQF